VANGKDSRYRDTEQPSRDWIKIKNPNYSQAEGRAEMFDELRGVSCSFHRKQSPDHRVLHNTEVERCKHVQLALELKRIIDQNQATVHNLVTVPSI